MNEIRCPECGSTISIDEDSYSNIIKQVRDQEFEDEMKKRIEILERDKQKSCLLYTSPSPRDRTRSRMPSSA